MSNVILVCDLIPMQIFHKVPLISLKAIEKWITLIFLKYYILSCSFDNNACDLLILINEPFSFKSCISRIGVALSYF